LSGKTDAKAVDFNDFNDTTGGSEQMLPRAERFFRSASILLSEIHVNDEAFEDSVVPHNCAADNASFS
jgi:hypothetical protein